MNIMKELVETNYCLALFVGTTGLDAHSCAMNTGFRSKFHVFTKP